MSVDDLPDSIDLVDLVLCTAEDFPGELGDDYPSACTMLGLPASDRGYALVLGQDERGARWTQVSTDIDGVAHVLGVWASRCEAGYAPPPDSVVTTRPGWLVECALQLPDRPTPHDPGRPLDEPDGRPTARRWTPARRRQLADQIAAELEEPPGEAEVDYVVNSLGEADPGPQRPRLVDLLRARVDLSQPPVQRAVSQAWKLAAAGNPPRGAVRTVRLGRHTRVIRATGDGWSLIARPTTGPAVLLLDDLPATAVDLTDLDRLPELLNALIAVAHR